MHLVTEGYTKIMERKLENLFRAPCPGLKAGGIQCKRTLSRLQTGYTTSHQWPCRTLVTNA
jgi:hypothetical protein